MSEKLKYPAFEQIAQRVKAERKSQGISQTDLANLSGVSLNFISQLESGKSTVRLSKVFQVLHVLGLEFRLVYRNEKGGA